MTLVLLIAAAHVVCALLVVRRVLRFASRADTVAGAALWAFATFYGLPIVLGVTTGRMAPWTIFLSAALAAAVAVAVVMASRRWGAPPQAGGLAAGVRAALSAWTALSWPERCLAAVVAVVLAATLAAGIQLPIRIWDAASYHAVNPMRWAETHRFILDSYGSADQNPYLAAAETYANVKAVLPFMVLAFTGAEAGTALAQWPFLVMACACLAAVARRLGLPRWAGFCATLFVLGAPEVILQSMEAYSDVVFLAGQTAVLWAVIVVWQDGPRLANLVLPALAFAVLAGSKPTGAPCAAALGLCFLVLVSLRRGAAPFVPMRRRLAVAAVALALTLAVCAAIAGPWYFHGLRKFSNPVYPICVRAAGRTIFPGPFPANMNTEYVERYTKNRGMRAWWHMMNESLRQPVLSSWWAGLGAHAMVLGLPCAALFVAAGLASGDRKRLAPALAMFAAMLVSCPTLVLARFVLFELAFMGLALGWVLSRTGRVPRHVLAAMFAGLLCYNWVRTVPAALYRTRPPELVAGALITGHSRAAMVDMFPDELTVLDLWREHYAKPGTVLGMPRDAAVWHARPMDRRATVVRVPDFVAGQGIDAWLRVLSQMGVTHVYLPRSSGAFAAASAAPTKFRLLVHRIDSGAETGGFLAPCEEAALFQIAQEHSPQG